MRISTNLVRELGDIKATDKELVQLIQMHIGEVEYSHNLSEDYKDIVIAEIIEKKEHPNADKLAVYKINYGAKEPIQVVAGDKSLKPKEKVAYMKVGCTVPYTIQTEEKPLKIKSVKLRGVTSNGMMGSAKELNVGVNNERVLSLPDDAPVGETFAQYYKLDDTVIEIENKALTNRGDLFGILGFSRELTAITGNRFKSPDWYLSYRKDLEPETNCLDVKIVNDAEAICPRYCAIAIDNIQVKQSPIWLKSTLLKCGIKPINNIVDITNYLSILIGQPLHAFDFDKLIDNNPSNKKTAHINIRMAKPDEKILALDDKLYDLDEEILVIADSSHPIAIAGVIGGKDTEVDESTKRIILESANFDKTSIRKTSMKLGIFSEAATRFKHNLDPEQCIPTLIKAVELIKQEAQGNIASQIIDIYHQVSKVKTIQIDPKHLRMVLGIDISTEKITSLLNNLEYRVVSKTTKGSLFGGNKESKTKFLYVTPPSWRKDVDIKEDIYEDVGRIYGFNNIDIKLPRKEIEPPVSNKIVRIKRKIREILSNSGANEMITYSFVNSDSFENCNLDNNLAYKIKNALSPDLSLMRTSILQSLLLKAKENIQRGQERFVTYEMNIAHLNNYIGKDKLPIEHWYLALLLTNIEQKKASSFYTAKRYLEKIFSSLGIHNAQYELVADTEESTLPVYIKNILGIFDPNTSAIVSVEGVKLGIIGEINQDVRMAHKLPEYSSGLEINIEELVKIKPANKLYKEKPKYPAFTQDLCFEMSVENRYSEIESEIEQILKKNALWCRVECLDIYQGPKSSNKKRITYRITASDYKKTLEEEDIKKVLEQITKSVVRKYKAVLI